MTGVRCSQPACSAARAFNFSHEALSFTLRLRKLGAGGRCDALESLDLGCGIGVLTLGASAATAAISGPWPSITGNDTGGIIPYSADLEGLYPQIAGDYCATWGRLSHVTSVHRRYGDYISFVCIDKPG